MSISVLSLGAGVQSSTLLLMSIKGELPKLDAAVFADTGWEPQEVYDHCDWLKAESENNGIPFYILKSGDLRQHTIDGKLRGIKSKGEQFVSIPLHVLKDNGEKAIVRRQCTRQYKVEPIQRFLKSEILGLDKHSRWPKEPVIDLWFGISSDEAVRIRNPEEKWKNHIYPLCNMPSNYFKKPYNRQRCVAWLGRNYKDRRIPRSACVGCPFKTNREWRYLRDQFPDEWIDVVKVDESLRTKGQGDTYLHSSCTPLKDANLGDDPNQLMFGGFGNECLGYCGN